jgi:hypothetical protein
MSVIDSITDIFYAYLAEVRDYQVSRGNPHKKGPSCVQGDYVYQLGCVGTYTNNTMDVYATWSFLEDDMLAVEGTSCVEECLQVMENDSVLDTIYSDICETDGLSLWPKDLYPDMYGKTLDLEKISQTIRFRMTQDLDLSGTFVSPSAHGMFISMLKPMISADTNYASRSAVRFDLYSVFGDTRNTLLAFFIFA